MPCPQLHLGCQMGRDLGILGKVFGFHLSPACEEVSATKELSWKHQPQYSWREIFRISWGWHHLLHFPVPGDTRLRAGWEGCAGDPNPTGTTSFSILLGPVSGRMSTWRTKLCCSPRLGDKNPKNQTPGSELGGGVS